MTLTKYESNVNERDFSKYFLIYPNYLKCLFSYHQKLLEILYN